MNYTHEEMLAHLIKKYGEQHEHIEQFKRLCANCYGIMEPLVNIAYEELINKTH